MFRENSFKVLTDHWFEGTLEVVMLMSTHGKFQKKERQSLYGLIHDGRVRKAVSSKQNELGRGVVEDENRETVSTKSWNPLRPLPRPYLPSNEMEYPLRIVTRERVIMVLNEYRMETLESELSSLRACRISKLSFLS